MMPLVLLGAGCGLGCWLAVRGLWPRPVSLDTLLARLDRPGLAVSAPVPVVAPLERAGLGVLRVLGLPVAPGTERQRLLALVGRTPERHALAKLAGCAAGAGGAALGAGVLGSVGLSLPAVVLAVLCSCGAVGGWVLPDLRLAEAAERRRRAFRHALSAYLDLVNVVLAGGGGIETALHEAAAAGDGWGFAAIRHALDRSRLTGRTPWECFALLGDELGVAELGELAASVALSGSHGARIRQSLAAKADTLRSHQVAETETAAEAATERMTVPLVVLLFGFLFFVAYPALSHVTAATAQRLP